MADHIATNPTAPAQGELPKVSANPAAQSADTQVTQETKKDAGTSENDAKPQANVATEKSEQKKDDGKHSIPEKYELKLSDKSPLDAAHLDKIATYAKERGLSQEEAQALVSRDEQLLTDDVNRRMQAYESERNSWRETMKADKEFGGDNLPKSVELARRALEKFGSKELRDELDRSGLGDHPELVRAFYRIGKAMADDSTVQSGSGDTKSSPRVADLLYGGTQRQP